MEKITSECPGFQGGGGCGGDLGSDHDLVIAKIQLKLTAHGKRPKTLS